MEWAPWQFFAISDEECWHAFGVEPRRGKPSYRYDDEVICTSYFSALEPIENGEVNVTLMRLSQIFIGNQINTSMKLFAK